MIIIAMEVLNENNHALLIEMMPNHPIQEQPIKIIGAILRKI